jgi:hypothetical protein
LRPFIASLFAPAPLLAFGLLFLAFVICGTSYGPVSTTLQDLVAPHGRATAMRSPKRRVRSGGLRQILFP